MLLRCRAPAYTRAVRIAYVLSLALAAVASGCKIQTVPDTPPPPPPAYGGGSYGGTSYGGAYGGFSYGAVTVEVITDDEGNEYSVQQGPRGEPTVLGCADGQREAFVNHEAFPDLAGCLASWAGITSMRAPATGAACGDDAGQCAAPADACAPGWQVCGADGSVAALRALRPDQCENAGGGRFSAAVSHCTAQTGCTYDPSPSASYPCFDSGWCSESVCCGNDCGQYGACTGGIWPDRTHIAQGVDQGCGRVSSRRAGGVLCCRAP